MVDAPNTRITTASKANLLEFDNQSKQLGASSRNTKVNEQGEIRIKFTDTSKMLPSETITCLYKDPGPNRSEAIEVKVNFAMAYGETQNFSIPIYSGNFAYKCTFSRRPGDHPERLEVIDNSCHVDQLGEKQRHDKVLQNLKTIIEKAMKLQLKKMNLRQDNFFKLEGQIKSIFHTKDANTAFLRLRITDTHAHQSTQQARGHFAEFGISSTNTMLQARNFKTDHLIQSYTDQKLDTQPFAEWQEITFVRPAEIWAEEDRTFKDGYEKLKAEHIKASQ